MSKLKNKTNKMTENQNTIIEKRAVNAVAEIFLERGSLIDPQFSYNDKFPLLDGCIIVYKTPNMDNDNISGMIDVQIKGKMQKKTDFNENIKFSIKKCFLQLIHDKLGGLFFVVKMASDDFKFKQVYYNLLDFQITSNLFKSINDHDTITISLKQFSSLFEFTKECEKYITNKKILLHQLEENNQNPLKKLVPKYDETKDIPEWYKTIYINGDKYFDKHPLITVYSKLKNNYRAIILIGEPRLGKSYEMKSLYKKLKKEKLFLARFFDLSQYNGNNLENDLGLSDPNLSYEIILDGYDEISPFHISTFNTNITDLSTKFKSAIFVISSRETCKNNIPILDNRMGNNIEVYLTISNFNDLLNVDDDEAIELLSIESETLRELFLVPIYRPILAEIDKNTSIYDTLIQYALRQNREKISEIYGTNALQSDNMIISRLAKAALKIYKSKKTFLKKEGNDLLFQTDFVKSFDSINYTFSNKTYYDYFVAINYLDSSLKDISDFFFINNNLNISTLDIFIILFDIITYRNKNLYKLLFDKLKSISVEAILLVDFSSIDIENRYKYFINILEYRNNNKKIYIMLGFFLFLVHLKMLVIWQGQCKNCCLNQNEVMLLIFLQLIYSNILIHPTKII